MASQINPDEAEIEAEIKARIDIVHRHFSSKDVSWGLNAVIKNWAKLVNWQ